MADGTNWLCSGEGISQAGGKEEDHILVATCGNPNCRARAVIDPGPRPSLLRKSSANRLEGSLRCICGMRSGVITTQPFWGPRPAMTGGFYLFVV